MKQFAEPAVAPSKPVVEPKTKPKIKPWSPEKPKVSPVILEKSELTKVAENEAVELIVKVDAHPEPKGKTLNWT